MFYDHKESNALILLNDKQYIGDADQFAKWALYHFEFMDKDGTHEYAKMASEAYTNAINHSQTRKFAQMNISHSSQEAQQVVFELFSDIAPLTCANFVSLCQGRYESSLIHRIVPGMYIQGGRVDGSTVDGEF